MTRRYCDSLVQGYLSSLGQSLVPPEAPASIPFSFRVVHEIYRAIYRDIAYAIVSKPGDDATVDGQSPAVRDRPSRRAGQAALGH